MLAAPSKPFSYGGRLSDAQGKPLAGFVDLTFSFHPASAGATTLGSPVLKNDVPLADGVFQITLDLEDADLNAIFADVSAPVWIQVADRTNTKVYPRQRFTVIPYALKIPVDGLTVDFDDEGLLHVGPLLPAGAGQFLTSDGSGKLIWDTPTGGGSGATVEDAVNDNEILKAPSENAVYDALALRDTALAGKEPTITSGTTAQYLRGDKSWQTVVTDAVADGVTAVAPSQNAVFDALAAKEAAIVAGTTAQYLRGDKTWQTLNTTGVAEGTNLYFTNARAKAAAVADSLADGVADVAPSQNAVFDALASRDVTIAGKEPAFAAGTTAQYLRGDKTWATLNTTTVTEAGGLYFTNARAQGAAVADSIVDATTNVAPSQNAVFDALALKQNGLGAGTTAQYLRGDQSWQTLDTTNVAEGTNQYFTTGRAKSAAVADAIADATTDVAPSQNAVFDALALKQNLTAKNAANGYAGLDASGKILPSKLPYAGLAFKGTWDAGTNTPTLTSGACGTSGDYYITAAGGATTLNGISTWGLGDWAICGTSNAWTRVGTPSGSGITTINGLTGTTVTMVTDDINEGSTNQYFTTARARAAAVADALNNGTTDVAPSQNAVFGALALKEGSVTAGTTAQYFRGDKTWATLNTTNVAEGTGLYFTNARAQAAAVADAIVDATTNVAPSQNAVFDALATKEGSITAGTSAQYFRGDKTWQTLSTTNVTEGTNQFFTISRAKSAAVADALADGVTDVAPSQNAVFDTVATINTTMSGKEPAITGGTTGQFWRGDKTWQTVVADAINDGTTAVAPSQNAVFDALALKAPLTHVHSSLDASDGSPAQAVMVDAAGNVGIGTTAPAVKLDVANTSIGGDTSSELFRLTGGADATLGPLLTIFGTHPSATGSSRYAYIGAGDLGSMRNLALNTNGAGAYGNVGVNTSSPQSSLHVYASGGASIPFLLGEGLASGNVGAYFGVDTAGNGTLTMAAQKAGTGFGSTAIQPNGGNVGIGTTSPNEQLELTGNLRLPQSTATTGIIKSGTNTFIHNYGSFTNFFAGVASGNLTLTGASNTGLGRATLSALSSGYNNVASGTLSQIATTTGAQNVSAGVFSLYANTTGNDNVAIGNRAGYSNTTGNSNTFLGSESGYIGTSASLTNATAIGYNAQVTASNSLILGNGANVGIGIMAPPNPLSVSPVQYSTGTASQSSTTVTGVGTTWTSAMVGSQLLFSNGTSAGTITAFSSTTSLTVSTSQTVTSQAYTINYLGLNVTSTGNAGIGTTSPSAKLQVVGQIVSALPSTNSPSGTTQTIDFNNGNIQVLSLASATGTVTLTFSNPVSGGSYAIKVIQGATARMLVWPAAVKWPSGTAITLSTANNAIDLVTMFYDGTNFYANYGNNYQ